MEDNSELQFFHGNLLREWGFQATIAKHGKEAIAILQSGAQFDFVVTDYLMPEMNGVEFIRWLADSGLHFKSVILFTSMHEDEPQIKTLEQDVMARFPYKFLHKTDIRLLRGILERAAKSE